MTDPSLLLDWLIADLRTSDETSEVSLTHNKVEALIGYLTLLQKLIYSIPPQEGMDPIEWLKSQCEDNCDCLPRRLLTILEKKRYG